MKIQTEASYGDLRRSLSRAEALLLDLRSPGEFELGQIPHAVNLPLLTNSERHDVGLLYKLEGRVPATQLGLELFAAKCEDFTTRLRELIATKKTVAVHCWRGGMRSRSVALWLKTMGTESVVLGGGYKAYRKWVTETLDHFALHPLIVLDGRTGCGKTALLRSLPTGFPAVNFEALARHRGSAFGGFAQPSPPPTQQNFENTVADSYENARHSPRIVVEIESVIGPVGLPHRLRDAVRRAPKVVVEREFDDRVERIAKEYAEGWNEDSHGQFQESMQMLSRHISAVDRATIIAAVAKFDFRTATAILLKLRYDPAYDKLLKRGEAQVIARFNLSADEDGARQFLADMAAKAP